jgi:hypothetical protein
LKLRGKGGWWQLVVAEIVPVETENERAYREKFLVELR